MNEGAAASTGADRVRLEPGWKSRIGDYLQREDMQQLRAFLRERVQKGANVFPPMPQVFAALDATPFDKVKVVILGQDPYHGFGQAHGLCFSVQHGTAVPPSLENVFKELQRDLGQQPAMCGHLGEWARCGVLLLNTSLTVEDGAAASHAKKGWESLTDALIAATARDAAPKVFLLWGAHAQAKAPLIEAAGNGHLVLQANHPSPLSATRGPVPFIGCGHFSAARDWLKGKGVGLEWSLD